MSEVRRLLEERQEELNCLKDMAENELKQAPKGNLRIAGKNDRVQYYHTFAEEKETHPNGRYISPKNQSLIRSLAQKSYDKKLLRQALTHSSFANEKRLNKLACNERLEFLGDAVLELAASEFLFREHEKLPEGDLTKLRASMVCEPTLALCAREIGIGDYILLGRG